MSVHRRWSETGTPLLTPAEQQAIRDFLAVQEGHEGDLQQATERAVLSHPELGPLMRSMSPEQIEAQNRTSRELAHRAVFDEQWQPFIDHLREQGYAYARGGLSFTAWCDLLSSYQAILIPHLLDLPDRARQASALTGMALYLDITMAILGEAYLRAKETIIGQQQSAIRELSTPVLQIRDRMLILPIIGVIDTQRARQLTEQLLHAIRAHRAKVVVMDITGVAAVDSKVANHLLQTVSAARLMGARVVVTGVSSDVAHALVALGVDTSQLNTTGDLQSGVEDAEQGLGYRVVRADEPRAPQP